RFTPTNTINKLPYEFDTWNVSGSSYVWVRVPVLTSNTCIRAWWGNPLALVQEPYTIDGSVWTQNFSAVYHLSETSGTIANESSASGFDGTLSGGMSGSDWVSGLVGNGADFDGAGDHIANNRSASDLGINGANPKHISGWIYTRAFNNGGMFDLGEQGNGQDFCLRTLGGANNWRAQHWGGGFDYDFNHPSLNTWVYFSHTYDGTTARTYADGDALVGSLATALNTLDNDLFRIGYYYGSAAAANAVIDEMRISTVLRGGDWMHAEWLNMISNDVFNCYSFVPAIPIVDNAGGATGVTAGSAFMNGTLVATGSAPATVAVYWGLTDGGADPAAWANT
ncbi:MAG: LamG-like jellyroll fold domain-containing protein, partial [Verrucomicrobiota bacterium]